MDPFLKKLFVGSERVRTFEESTKDDTFTSLSGAEVYLGCMVFTGENDLDLGVSSVTDGSIRALNLVFFCVTSSLAQFALGFHTCSYLQGSCLSSSGAFA